MSVAEQTPVAGYTGNGVTTAFSFPFTVLAEGDLGVLVDGTLQTLNVAYTVSGVGGSSGTVTFTTAPASSAAIVIYRDSDLTRATDYQDNGDLLAATINLDLDRLWLALQEVLSGAKASPRSVRAPIGETLSDLPDASDRAGKVMSFNASTGDVEAVAPTEGTATALSILLAGTSSGQGASQVGVQDAGSLLTATTVETALQEIALRTGVNRVLYPSGGDDSSALQAMVTALTGTGGTIRFLAGQRYKLGGSQVTVSSLYPINLLGEMGGLHHDVAGSMPCIEISAALAGSLIKYTAPNSGSRGSHGGGVIRGLAFIDPTGSGGTPGSRTVTAALELNDFACSKVDGCVFQWISGSAIKGEFVVMSDIANNVVRYCGDTSKPALYFPSTNAIFPAQSCNIYGNRVEVCNDAAYISLGANSQMCRLWGNGFEADTTNAASNQEFLTLAGVGCQVFGNSFNRNTGSQMTVSGSGNAITGNLFAGGAFSTTAVTISGARNLMSGNTHRSTRTGFEVSITGRGNSYVGNQLYASGSIKASAASCKIDSNNLDQMSATSAALGAGNEWWISLESTATASSANGNTLNNNGGSVTDVGGIRVACTAPQVHSNNLNAFAGTGNGAICIRSETGNASIVGNTESNSTTFISASTVSGSEYRANYPISSTATIPLQGSATWDPASIAVGASATTTVSVSGAAVGDYVRASFSLTLAGLVLNGYVSGANTVTAVLSNPTAGAVDLASGTLKVVVEKR